MSEMLPRLQDIFRDVFDDARLVIGPESSAKTVPGWDSLIHVTLVAAIEQEFHIRFALGELETLRDVGDMMELIGRKLAV